MSAAISASTRSSCARSPAVSTNHNYQREHRYNLWFVLVVVVDLGVLADALGDPLQTLLGHRQGSQGAGPGALVAEHRADPRQRAVGFQATQPFEHLGFAATQGLGHPSIGVRADRQAFLVAGEEAAGEVVHGAS